MSENEEQRISELSTLLPHETVLIPETRVCADSVQSLGIRSVTGLVTLLCFTFMIGTALITAPQIRILESIICRQYYERDPEFTGSLDDIDEHLCKNNKVQQDLTILSSRMLLLDAIVGIPLTCIYGHFAERIGRSVVFGLAVFGIILSQIWIALVCWFWGDNNLDLVLLSSITQIFGGGEEVFMNMLYSSLIDVSTVTSNSKQFLFFSSGRLLGLFVGNVCASLLMKQARWGPWHSYLIGVITIIAVPLCAAYIITLIVKATTKSTVGQNAVGISSTLPSRASYITRPSSVSSKSSDISPSPTMLSSSSNSSLPPHTLSPSPSPTPILPTSTSTLTNISIMVHTKFRMLKSAFTISIKFPVLCLVLSSVTTPMISQAIHFSTQYFSKRLSWTLSEATWWLSFGTSLFNVAVLLVIPPIKMVLQRDGKFGLRLKSRSIDIVLGLFSLLFLISGASFVAWTPSKPVALLGVLTMTAGTGFPDLCRSVATELVSKDYVHRLNYAISAVRLLGSILYNLVRPKLYQLGMEWAGKTQQKIWIGLPFWPVVLCCILCLILNAFGLGSIYSEEEQQNDDRLE